MQLSANDCPTLLREKRVLFSYHSVFKSRFASLSTLNAFGLVTIAKEADFAAVCSDFAAAAGDCCRPQGQQQSPPGQKMKCNLWTEVTVRKKIDHASREIIA